MPRTEGRSPLKRESRPAFVAERLPVICQLGGDDHGDNSKAPRFQTSSGRYGGTRIGGTLTLARKGQPPASEEASRAGRASSTYPIADPFNLNSAEANALQRCHAKLWDERNAWDIRRRTAPPTPLEREAMAWASIRGKAVRRG